MAEKTTEKEMFTILGQFHDTKSGRKFIPTSPKYYRDRCSHMPLNKQFAVKFTTKIPTRSEFQLRYHFVLMGYIADYTGDRVEEVHDAIMRDKFGTKKIKIGEIVQEVRPSVSDKALFPKGYMVELISYDLEICHRLGIYVPTMEELGYVPR